MMPYVDDSKSTDIRALARDYVDGESVGEHCHKDGQFIHATAGVMEIRTPMRLWLVPPQRGLWIPPCIPHALRARGKVTLRTVYIAASKVTSCLGEQPGGFMVSAFLREIILKSLSQDVIEDHPRFHRLAGVLLDELSHLTPDRLSLAMPIDKRLALACAEILSTPDINPGMGALSKQAGTSIRTLTRLAQKEFGCSLSIWRQQALVLTAVPKLIAGEPVASIADTLGYETPSAFAAMFRRIMGVTPGNYR
ncbi:helix-turn-helix transcriptional regulator [Gluconobacter cerinus]|uniref:AraC family transcriptional regulator n=1 Tax=Gluconobacter cerinus TaxID=38307 RepID=UPI001B8B1B5F|nr:helix-turn-helix transcriptional regulator [Gluconobacter cerinus]MBS1018732.1 helix-turn-helix transcriptional regulator [Gluconobacter cerinus]